jgi:hypothetical protein
MFFFGFGLCIEECRRISEGGRNKRRTVTGKREAAEEN